MSRRAEVPGQLPMFMTPHEILASHTLMDLHDGESPNKLLRRKVIESQQPAGRGHGTGIYTSIAKEGVHEPITIGHFEGEDSVMDGHHRLAAQHHLNPHQFVPVEHMDEDNMGF